MQSKASPAAKDSLFTFSLYSGLDQQHVLGTPKVINSIQSEELMTKSLFDSPDFKALSQGLKTEYLVATLYLNLKPIIEKMTTEAPEKMGMASIFTKLLPSIVYGQYNFDPTKQLYESVLKIRFTPKSPHKTRAPLKIKTIYIPLRGGRPLTQE